MNEVTYNEKYDTYNILGLDAIYLEIILEMLWSDNGTAWIAEEIEDKIAEGGYYD